MCNHAGLYEVDIDLMSVFIGEKITEDEINLQKNKHKNTENIQ